MANLIYIAMKLIMEDMDIGSKFMEFLDDFELIESHVNTLPANHPAHSAWSVLYGAIYEAKGDLDSVRDEMDDFLRVFEA